jgi:flagellar hook-associated protein 2
MIIARVADNKNTESFMATTPTTSATNTAAATTTQRVDYISALNAGSGLNTTQIVDTLVNAEVVPKQTKINEQVEEKNVSISSLGQVKTEFTNFDTNLALLADQTGLVAASSSSAIEVIPDNANALAPFFHNFTVSNLASAHTLSFPGFSSATATVPEAGTMVFSIGTYSGDSFTRDTDVTQQSITMTSTTTVQDLAAQINNLSGMNLTASVIKVSDDNYSLMVKSELGESKQLQIVARDTLNAEISELNFESPATSDSSKQVIEGGNASFTLDGITITRSTNTIDDLVDGVTLELKATSASNIEVGAAYDEAQALDILTAFVSQVNTLRTTMTDLTDMGSNGDDAGPLRGDTLIRSYVNRLKAITTTPISNYKDEPIFLSSFGVMTELDGSLSIDTIKFTEYFQSNPTDFSALTQNRVTTGSNLVKASANGSLYKAGTYDLTFESDDDRATFTGATLDGVAMVFEGNVFKGDSANTLGIDIEPSIGAPDTKLFIGNSLIDMLRQFSKSVLTPGNAIDSKISTYSDEITTYEDELLKLETAMETARARYTQQFTAMESAVSSFRKTGEYLENFMESWRAGLG